MNQPWITIAKKCIIAGSWPGKKSRPTFDSDFANHPKQQWEFFDTFFFLKITADFFHKTLVFGPIPLTSFQKISESFRNDFLEISYALKSVKLKVWAKRVEPNAWGPDSSSERFYHPQSLMDRNFVPFYPQRLKVPLWNDLDLLVTNFKDRFCSLKMIPFT